ncbi:MAG: OmpA family protein [Burkholderiales bacterium]|nr:OmpA family protein [Burkholderiales bacterium]
MSRNPARIVLALSLGLATAAFAEPDRKGCADPALFPTRMPGYFIADCKSAEFDAYPFKTANPRAPNRQEGKFTFVTYQLERGKQEPGAVAVVRNYEEALKKIGGNIAASTPNWWVNGSVMVDGREVWAEAERGNGKIWIRTIEKVAMKQHVVADAAALSSDIRAKGHVAVYDIHFDTGKSVVKPESKPALDEVAKLLKSDPALRLWVVGHTDSVGKVDDNMRLAQARGEAVVAELVGAYGIAAGRLKGYGVGPLAPVAGNDDEAGRAKNRRVDLVKAP